MNLKRLLKKMFRYAKPWLKTAISMCKVVMAVELLTQYWEPYPVEGPARVLTVFQTAFEIQNELRKVGHGVLPLIWNDTLAEEATAHANAFVQHPNRLYDLVLKSGKNGVNFYGVKLPVNNSLPSSPNGASMPDIKAVAVEAVQNWYKEAHLYDFYSSKFSFETRHFTQMVWADSRQVGFGAAQDAETGWTVVVAYYFPAGNLEFSFRENVLPYQYIYEVEVHTLD